MGHGSKCGAFGSLGVLALTACGGDRAPTSELAAGADTRWCAELPRAANQAFPLVPVASDWFEVRRVEEGVYAFIESRQFQEAISYLIVGTDRALMFDTGLGLVPIRPVAEQLTSLPIEVLNSHTHYDHVGGNAEFDHILALETRKDRE